METDFHSRERFNHIILCPAEVIDFEGTTHQCKDERSHGAEHECRCGKRWEHPQFGGIAGSKREGP